ncbi:MAG: proprotein convertase P-domain-containing protein [Myxococcota bacterium]
MRLPALLSAMILTVSGVCEAAGPCTTDDACMAVDARAFSNDDGMQIHDSARAVYSEISVFGVDAKDAEEMILQIDISHPSRGDLEINLVSPEGSRYRLKPRNAVDRLDDIQGTWVIDASRDNTEGIWKLEMVDHYLGNTGHLNQWSLTF